MMTREQLQQRHADDVKKVMATESGRRFVWGFSIRLVCFASHSPAR